jgi:hypothetical protein
MLQLSARHDVAVSEGGLAFTTYFSDREPIDGRLTVVDLTESSSRWPTGNPRDLKTFRYCGEAARGGSTSNTTRGLLTCQGPPDLRRDTGADLVERPRAG